MPKYLGRNAISLFSSPNPTSISNFQLCEFENIDGLAMVHSSVLTSLERVRLDLALHLRQTVHLIITDAVRTQSDLDRLAAKYGWQKDGGKVAENSMHLAKHGGIAVDLIGKIADSQTPISQHLLAQYCRLHFDFVLANYPDGHVHADNRHHKLIA